MRLLQSQRALILSLKRKWSDMQKLKEQLQIAAIKLETVIDMFTLSLDYDRDSYNPQHFGEAGKTCLLEWDSLSNDAYTMRKYTEINGQLNNIVSKHEDFSTLQKNPLVTGQQKNELEDM